MSTLIGALRVTLGLDAATFTKGLDENTKKLKTTMRTWDEVGKGMTGIGNTLSLAVTLPMAALGKTSITAAMESKDALAQVNQALTTMGGAAGRTAEQLSALANTQMHQSLYDDDDILRQVTANLLTFGNVSGEVFDRAQQSALDLSARLGQDLQSSAMQLGKALNDPAKGLTALQRVGVSFTEQQKEQIKAMAAAGDMAGAQGIILDELGRQFGGAAAAAAKSDPFAQIKHNMADFQEAVGGVLLKILPPLTKMLNDVLGAFNGLSPGTQDFIVKAGLIGGALGPILSIGGNLVGAFGKLLPLFKTLGPVIGIVSKAMLGLLANPVLLAAAAVIGGIYLAWTHWDDIKRIVGDLGKAISDWWTANVKPVLDQVVGAVKNVVMAYVNFYKGVFDAVSKIFGAVKEWLGDKLGKLWGTIKTGAVAAFEFYWTLPGRMIAVARQLYDGVKLWVQDKLGAVWDWLMTKIDAVKKKFFGLYDAVVGHSYVPDMVDGIASHFGRLQSVMVNPAEDAITRTNAAFAAMGKNALSGFVPGAGIPGALEAIGGAANDNAGEVAEANKKVAESFEEMAKRALGAMRGLVDAIKGGDIFSILGAAANLIGTIMGGKSGDVLTKIGGILSDGSGGGIPGFASGTGSAPRGLAMVGERGPELVNFRGGERVWSNGQTRGMMGGGDPRGGHRGTVNNYHYYGPGAEEFWGKVSTIGAFQGAVAVGRERARGVRKQQRSLV